ncbi:hypothetical protein [Methylobacterium sp. Leaf93]|uniref:hypothetical protein n=1 Tax=Methylobacterium sp. Leaf93 TaxID=1736249 RepID=UPI0006F8F89E|nr:hypothetical protein [Methylobacterium sp. Leaf93]KQP03306.1 hypothetical protein ASF26_13435 [Methylobacterium sp. Leaf93]
MEDWKDGVDPELFNTDLRPQDDVVIVGDIEAINPRGGKLTLKKGSFFKVRMLGGILFCRPKGGGKHDEIAVMPADFRNVQFLQLKVVSVE